MTLRRDPAVFAWLLFCFAAAFCQEADPSPQPLDGSSQKVDPEQAQAIAALKEKRFVPDTDKDGQVVSLNMGLLFTRRGAIDQDLVHVARLTSLRRLELRRAGVTDAGLESLKTLTHLRSLILPPGITEDGLRHLAAFRELEVLVFDPDSRVSDEGMKHLAGLPKLTHLRLNGRIGDRGAAVLGRFKTLRELDFYGAASLTEAGLVELEGLDNLEKLGLNGFTLTDHSLQSLARMKQLRTLVLRYATEKALNDDHVEGLSKLTQLKELDLASFAPTLTASGLARLRAALPGTKVKFLTLAEDNAGKHY